MSIVGETCYEKSCGLQGVHKRMLEFHLRREELPENLITIPMNDQIRELQTILRDKTTTQSDFVFCADRLIRLVVEEGLNQLPYTESTVVTPTGSHYDGLEFNKGNCGVSIIRSGEAMEKALRECCRSIRIGKILAQSDKETKECCVFYAKLIPDIARRKVLLLYPSVLQVLHAYPDVRILTSEVHPVAPNHFGQKYFENRKCASGLACLLKAVQGETATVELRNNVYLHGRVDQSDAWLNVELTNVIYFPRFGKPVRFDRFFVAGKHLRFVHIPDHIDMLSAVKGEVKKLTVRQKSAPFKPNRKQRLEELIEKRTQQLKTHELIPDD